VIDSHTHLASCGEPDEELIAEARASGVTRMLTVGTDPASSRAALQLAAEHHDVFAAVGLHPNNATGVTDAVLAEIGELATHEQCVAVGETGRDDFRNYAPVDDQRTAFLAQIEIARTVDKPLVIHTRAADQDTITTLRDHAQGVRVILHCFSMPDKLDECLAEGWWISFAGNVTYPKSHDLAEAATHVPDDKLLVETDAPYLTPQAVRKHRNRPAFVTETAQFLAEQRDQTYAELDAIVTANAEALFGW
jgi:TatD DNase family protein